MTQVEGSATDSEKMRHSSLGHLSPDEYEKMMITDQQPAAVG
jgi:hypothetical protein